MKSCVLSVGDSQNCPKSPGGHPTLSTKPGVATKQETGWKETKTPEHMLPMEREKALQQSFSLSSSNKDLGISKLKMIPFPHMV